MSDRELISVIVPVYRVERWLERCIESIVAQTYTNLEIILVDDGSDDGCGKICDEWAQKDSRILVIHKENEGLVRARKTGLLRAGGSYVGYVDSDDWIEPDMYERLMEKMAENGCDLVASGRVEEYVEKREYCCNQIPEGCYSGQSLARQVWPGMLSSAQGELFCLYPTVWDKLFQKELLLGCQMGVPDELRVGEDVACVYPAVLRARSVYVLNECLYHYNRARESSMLASRDHLYFNRIYVLKEYLEGVFQEYGDEAGLLRQLDDYIWDLAFNGIGKEFGVYKPLFPKCGYLFPYELVQASSGIILYGAGNVGREFMRQISYNKYCRVLKWVDKSPGIPGVNGISAITECEYDYIIVAVLRETVAEEIKAVLIDLGVAEQKIIWKDYRF